jgi:hypothetical protein
VLLGWLKVSGRGFVPNAEKTVFEYGFGASVRAQRQWDRWALWLDARANLWPAPERAQLIESDAAATTLPKLDVLLSLGVSILALR